MIRKRINPFRFSGATAVLLACCFSVLTWVNSAGSVGGYAIAVALVGGVVFTLIPASILEWHVHRYIYHREQFEPLAQIFRIHHKGHHAAIFPTWRYTTNGSVCRHPITGADVSRLYPAGWKNAFPKVAHFVFYMAYGCAFVWTPAWLLTHNPVFLGSIFVTSVILSDLFVRVHDAIHYPGQFRFVEAQPWYPFIDRHHFIHHVDMEANVNFLLPLADWCYGTLRTTLTVQEIEKHGTLQEAKSSPVGRSEPAAVFASQLKRRATDGSCFPGHRKGRQIHL